MGRGTVSVARLEEHPNLGEVLGVLAQLAHISDDDIVALAGAWVNSPSLSEARDRALSPDSPLVVEVLAAFDALSAMFADDLAGAADYVVVASDVTVRALKAVRDAIAAAYARPVLSRTEHSALLRPWRTVFPQATVDEPDLGPRSAQVKALLSALPRLSGRCHDESGQALFDALVDRSYVGEADRAEAAATAFQAAVLTSRRRVWALIRRTGTQGLLRPCGTCRTPVSRDRDHQRVLELCLDAACALLVADAVPDACTDLLADPVLALIPQQRLPGSPS
ncbi:MAG: hypothetical protein LH469_13850 [Frankiaceae bacterium]|nr:hypothetical protein [Frankiaceae bacterium]